jgi:butyrate kinase
MYILAIDPGSTSTKLGIYDGNQIYKENFIHDREIIKKFETIYEQKNMRYDCIENFLDKSEWADIKFDAIVARGGLMKPVKGGTIKVNTKLLEDLKNGYNGHHASNLGGILAYEFAEKFNCNAYVVDPVVVDEMSDLAKLSGFSEIKRKSIFHALNQKSMARKVADKLGKSYYDVNLIVAHMGGGITVGLHEKGRVVDVNDGLCGDGPFAPERTGGLPLIGVLELIKSKKYSVDELIRKFTREGGVYSYLGIVDIREVEKLSKNDSFAKLILNGMIYQISKEIGSLATIVNGNVDGIVITGGIAHSEYITKEIDKKVNFIANVFVEPGEFEIEALIEGSLRVLNNEEIALEYR